MSLLASRKSNLACAYKGVAASLALALSSSPAIAAGLDQGPGNASCAAPASHEIRSAFSLERVFPSLSFSAPVAMAQAPRDHARWFVVEQGGRIVVFENDKDVSSTSDFIDITSRVESGGSKGLLSLAFHPNFPEDPRAYLAYTTRTDSSLTGPLVSQVSEFSTTDDGSTLDPATERVLLSINQPEQNNLVGRTEFGPDGYLYVGVGDGGGEGDNHGPIGNGQSLRTLLGKVLRIDVDSAAPGFNYSVPDSNPFAGGALCGATGSGIASCPEIYAYGFRNPWRWSFDRHNGALWVADVGEHSWEEVNRVRRGGNYGWRCREGAHEYNSDCGPARSSIDPVAEYDHNAGNSIIGGYVYRGASIPWLRGRYVFGDFGSGRIWHIASPARRAANRTLRVTTAHAFRSGLSISSFAEDLDGELYVVDYFVGGLYRLQPASRSGTSPVQAPSSTSGCVSARDALQPSIESY